MTGVQTCALPIRIVVSVDARRGRAAAAGWTQQSDMLAEEALRELAAYGVTQFVYSSIERDGMLEGPDAEEVARVCAVVPEAGIVYSGGIASASDLAALARLRLPALRGVIVGTALFEDRLTVSAGQAALDGAQ